MAVGTIRRRTKHHGRERRKYRASVRAIGRRVLPNRFALRTLDVRYRTDAGARRSAGCLRVPPICVARRGSSASTSLHHEAAMLRSMKDMEDYTIGATDGIIGRVKDFYFDDDAWVIRYLVVDAGEGQRKVLISPISIGQPNWSEKILPVSLTRT